MPEEAFSQRPVEALHDALVPVGVNPTALNLDRVLRQQLTDGAHELTAGVNLKELRPPQGAPLVIPDKAIGDLCRSYASQGLGLFVAAGDVNDRESITEGFPSYAVVWQEEQVCLMTSFGTATSNFGRGMCRGADRKICQMACFLSQSLACCSVTFAADASFLMAVSPFQ